MPSPLAHALDSADDLTRALGEQLDSLDASDGAPPVEVATLEAWLEDERLLIQRGVAKIVEAWRTNALSTRAASAVLERLVVQVRLAYERRFQRPLTPP
jgi:hypothetical protein